MKYTITIDTDNAAFGERGSYEEAAELSRILQYLALQATVDGILYTDQALADINGNTVGHVEASDID